MLTSDFDYPLPDELIAQEPAPTRDASRLLVMDSKSSDLRDHVFGDLPHVLPPGALLVMNDSRVFPARLRGHKDTGGKVEVLLIRAERDHGGDGHLGHSGRRDAPLWQTLCRSSKGLRDGQRIRFEAPAFPPQGGDKAVREVWASVEATGPNGLALLAFHEPAWWRVAPEASAMDNDECATSVPGSWADSFLEWVQAAGETPLPPYIRRPRGELSFDHLRYQTVYARHAGSVAAPTAGLHFTPKLLFSLDQAGFRRATLTLHVGPGTFRPVRQERAEDHRMDEEEVTLGQETVRALEAARAEGRPIVAVGTTTVRALEAAARRPGGLAAGSFFTDLFIRPGHQFLVVDGLITNFHLPSSTLLMLVAALATRERILEAYRHAVASAYRFYSYGDAMLIR